MLHPVMLFSFSAVLNIRQVIVRADKDFSFTSCMVISNRFKYVFRNRNTKFLSTFIITGDVYMCLCLFYCAMLLHTVFRSVLQADSKKSDPNKKVEKLDEIPNEFECCFCTSKVVLPFLINSYRLSSSKLSVHALSFQTHHFILYLK